MGPVQGAGAEVDGGGEVGAKRRKKSARTRRGPRTVEEAIRAANAILPGKLKRGAGADPRWQAVFAVGDFADTDAPAVWSFVERWGHHRSLDLRSAVAIMVVEDLLWSDFDFVYPRLVERVRAEPRFADALTWIWYSGLPPAQTRRMNRLMSEAEKRSERWRAAQRRRDRRR